MSLILIIFLVLELIQISAMAYLFVRLSKSLLAFDDVFQMLCDDIETNIAYFEKLESTPLLSNSPEVITAAHNMNIMKLRLDEFARQIFERTGKKREKKIKNSNPPVVR